MGLHVSSQGIAFESARAKAWNSEVRQIAPPPTSLVVIAQERAACPTPRGQARAALQLQMAIARPPRQNHLRGNKRLLETIPANIYTHKTLSGATRSRTVAGEAATSKNKDDKRGEIDPRARGIGPAPDFLSPRRGVYKTRSRRPRWLLNRADSRVHRQEQSELTPATSNKWELMSSTSRRGRGIKSIIPRSKSVQRAGSREGSRPTTREAPVYACADDYDECMRSKPG